MGKTHDFKIYTAENEYIASVKSPFYGAMILAGLSSRGTTIRFGHLNRHTVYTDMIDGHASESYDEVERISLHRTEEIINHQKII